MCTGVVIAKVTSLVVEEKHPLEIDTGRLCILTLRLPVSYRRPVHWLPIWCMCMLRYALAIFWKCPTLLPLWISSTLKTRLGYMEPHRVTQGCSPVRI